MYKMNMLIMAVLMFSFLPGNLGYAADPAKPLLEADTNLLPAPTVNQNQKKPDTQIQNLSTEVGKIPKIATITEGMNKIDFLKDTYTMTEDANTVVNNTQANSRMAARSLSNRITGSEKIYLGRKNGKEVYHVKNTNQLSTLSKTEAAVSQNTRQSIITYNHRRDLLGVFEGRMNLVANHPDYIQELEKKYPITLELYSDRYVMVKLRTIDQVKQIFAAMSADENLESVQLVINEDEIVLH